MAKAIDEVREHVLWNVRYQLQENTRKAAAYESGQQGSGGLGLKQTWASFRLAQMRAKILWWSEIETAIESNEPSRAMIALELLIRHYKPSKFCLKYFGLLSSTPGFAILAGELVSEKIREATELQEHYRQQAA